LTGVARPRPLGHLPGVTRKASFGTPLPAGRGVESRWKEAAMTETILSPEPTEAPADLPEAVEEPIEEGLIAGRPVEDRSFEVVEIGVGASAGLAIGAVVAGPVGAAAGAIVGAAAAIVAGEALERRVGHAAETTDATEHEPAPHT
jgi:hypothetical protein